MLVVSLWLSKSFGSGSLDPIRVTSMMPGSMEDASK